MWHGAGKKWVHKSTVGAVGGRLPSLREHMVERNQMGLNRNRVQATHPARVSLHETGCTSVITVSLLNETVT